MITLTIINDLLRYLCNQKKYSHICFVGDFNFKDINWENWTTNKSEGSAERKFLESLRDCFLYQNITEPTRNRGTDEPSLIDLILTNEEMQVGDISYLAPLGKSDHSVLIFDYSCYIDNENSSKKYLYGKADYNIIKDHLLSQDWKGQFILNHTASPVETMWTEFKSKLLEVRDKFVEQKQAGPPVWKRKGDVPIDKNLQHLIKRKGKLHRRWINNLKNGRNCEEDRKAYTKVRNQVKNRMLNTKIKFEKDIAERSKHSPKVFWSYTRSKLKTKTGVAPLLENTNDKSSIRYSDKQKADILQKQFASVFTREPDGELPKFDLRTLSEINLPDINPEIVRKKILELDADKACGPDEIHPRLLKELADIISTPLAMIFRKSLLDGTLPSDWKHANVSPIFKKGAKNIASNYRPISLTSIACKIMESIIKDEIMSHLMDKKLITSRQYGFIPGRSTTTQLLNYLNDCIEALVEGYVTDTIYFDFSKAFDTVPHHRLLKKLKCYGIKGQVLKWIESFLKGRSQVVKVNDIDSFLESVISGIPQGSVLGPILFVIYINDLPDVVKSKIYLFADDTKILNKIQSLQDSTNLQEDINPLGKWSNDWLLQFNLDKCHVLTLGKHYNIVHAHRYQLNDHELEHVFDEKDIGVILDPELKFEEHIAAKVKKANAMMGLIRRSFSHLGPDLFKKLYTTFVRPHLEYAQAVWSPHLRKNINLIENVQRRATKLVDGFRNLTHEERLQRLKLPTLEFRRNLNDMVEIYKFFHIYDKLTIPDVFQPQSRPSRKHNYQLVSRVPRDGARGPQTNSFYFRTIRTWNDLPSNIVESTSVPMFKLSLERAWEEQKYS